MTDTHYKLTNADMRTYGGTQWVIGEWRETDGQGELCCSGWLHAYETPELALLLNPSHADIQNPRLFRAEGAGEIKRDRQLKLGRTRLRLVEELTLPVVTTEQCVTFGILCASHVCSDERWNEWAWGWLLGVDRSAAAAAVIWCLALPKTEGAAAAYHSAEAAWHSDTAWCLDVFSLSAQAAAAAWCSAAAASAAVALRSAELRLDLAEIARVALAWGGAGK